MQTGSQAVSLGDLMKLGIPALNAMAQGQTPTIAPSYMVISALKALTDQQRGMQQPMSNATVKDMVVAQAQPQPGIAGLMPQQQQPRSFYGGGPVRSPEESYDETYLGYTPPRSIFEALRDYLRGKGTVYEHKEDKQKKEDKKETVPALTEMPTGPLYPIPDIEVAPSNVASPSRVAASVRATSSSTNRGGIASTGANPVDKYAFKDYVNPEIKQRPLSEIEGLQIPENTYLNAALKKYGAPDEARMKELKDAERSAGLAAFARGVMDTRRGRGLGAVLGSASADATDAMLARADKRREYEDSREQMALNLGLRKGTEEYERWMKNTEFKLGQQKADLERQYKERERGDKITTEENARSLKLRELQQQKEIAEMENATRREANAIQAAIRKDGVNERNFTKLLRLQQQATATAAAYAESVHGKVDQTAKMMDPNLIRNFRNEFKQKYDDIFPPSLQKQLEIMSGMPQTGDTPAAASNKVIRATFP